MWSTVTPATTGDGSTPPVTPSARSKHAACFLDGKLYLLGGRNGNLPLKDFWQYDLCKCPEVLGHSDLSFRISSAWCDTFIVQGVKRS